MKSRERTCFEPINTKELKKLDKSKLLDIIYKYDKEVSSLNSELSKKDTEIQTYVCQIEDLQEQQKSMKSHNQIMSLELLEVHKSSDQMKEKLELAEDELKYLTKKVNGRGNLNNFSDNSEQDLGKINAYTQTDLDAAGEDNDILAKKYTMLKHACDLIHKKLNVKKRAIKDFKTQNRDLKKENTVLKNKINQLNKEFTSYKNREDKYQFDSSLVGALKEKYEEINALYKKSLQKNNKLIEKIKEMKTQKANISKPSFFKPSAKTFMTIKAKISCLYKDFLRNAKNESWNKKEFYIFEGADYYILEKKLNEVISDLHEYIEDSYTVEEIEKKRVSSSMSNRMGMCFSLADSQRGVLIKRHSSKIG